MKKRVRNGRTRWVIDFYYTNKNGERERFVRFAELQTRDGAEREARQLYERATLTGSPDVVPEAAPVIVAVGVFYEDTFRPVLVPKHRPSTRTRYEALWRQRVTAAFESTPLRDLDAAALARFAAGKGEGRQAKGPVRFVQDPARHGGPAQAAARAADTAEGAPHGASARRPKRELTAVVAVQRRPPSRRTWSVHAPRHASCAHLVREGIGVEAARALAGHSSSTVANRYVHAQATDLRAAMGRRAFSVVASR